MSSYGAGSISLYRAFSPEGSVWFVSRREAEAYAAQNDDVTVDEIRIVKLTKAVLVAALNNESCWLVERTASDAEERETTRRLDDLQKRPLHADGSED